MNFFYIHEILVTVWLNELLNESTHPNVEFYYMDEKL